MDRKIKNDDWSVDVAKARGHGKLRGPLILPDPSHVNHLNIKSLARHVLGVEDYYMQ